jgi:hypothetical protein
MAGLSFSEMLENGLVSDTRTLPLPLEDIHSVNPASWMYERLVKSIVEFEKKLDQTKEVGASLANFGAQEAISIEALGYWGPDLVRFYGKNSQGNPVDLLQHISQINVLLVAMPAQATPPRRIGFVLEGELQQIKKESEKGKSGAE